MNVACDGIFGPELLHVGQVRVRVAAPVKRVGFVELPHAVAFEDTAFANQTTEAARGVSAAAEAEQKDLVAGLKLLRQPLVAQFDPGRETFAGNAAADVIIPVCAHSVEIQHDLLGRGVNQPFDFDDIGVLRVFRWIVFRRQAEGRFIRVKGDRLVPRPVEANDDFLWHTGSFPFPVMTSCPLGRAYSLGGVCQQRFLAPFGGVTSLNFPPPRSGFLQRISQSDAIEADGTHLILATVDAKRL